MNEIGHFHRDWIIDSTPMTNGTQKEGEADNWSRSPSRPDSLSTSKLFYCLLFRILYSWAPLVLPVYQLCHYAGGVSFYARHVSA